MVVTQVRIIDWSCVHTVTKSSRMNKKGIIFCGFLNLVLCLIAKAGYWHAYDPHKDSTASTCTQYENKAQNISLLVENYKMWPNLTNYKRNLDKNSTIYGMEYAFGAIWKHQHPADCSKAKFLINGFHNGGFGSELHVLGAVLGLGLEMGRVVIQNPLVHPSVSWEVDNPFCKNSDTRNLQCYYEPWSSCTIYDALGPDALKILKGASIMGPRPFHLPTLEGFPFPTDNVEKMADANFRNNFIKQHDKMRTVMVKVPGWLKFGIIPHQFRPLLDCSPVQKQFQYYWWRAIAAAYIVRPNAAVLNWMNTHAMKSYDNTEEYLAIYIRRGDKSIEAKLPPVDTFTNTIEMMYSKGHMPSPTDGGKRLVFLASEDSSVLQAMTQWNAKEQRYDMQYTNVFDRKGLLAERSAEERERNTHNGPDHHPEEYLSMLLNVHYLVRGNGYICTLSSNFCRLVDELRATVGGKADRPYADLSEETCAAPPCIYNNLKFLDWR